MVTLKAKDAKEKRKNGEMGEQKFSGTHMITTKIPKATYLKAKTLGVKFNHLIELGLRAYQDNPQIISRIRTLEETITVQRHLIERHAQRLYELERKQ